MRALILALLLPAAASAMPVDYMPPSINGSTDTVADIIAGNGSITNLSASTVTILQDVTTGDPSYPNTPLLMKGNANTYFQQVMQNLSNGNNASSDFILVNNLGGDASYYLDIGINSAKFSQAGQTVEASSSGFVSTSDSPLVIWADTNGGLNGGNGHVLIGSSNPVTANQGVDISSNNFIAAGPAFSVGTSSFTVSGGSATVAYGLTAARVTITSGTLSISGTSPTINIGSVTWAVGGLVSTISLPSSPSGVIAGLDVDVAGVTGGYFGVTAGAGSSQVARFGNNTAGYVQANGANFGIGTTSPGFKLDVNGAVNISSAALTIGGSGAGLFIGASTSNVAGAWTAWTPTQTGVTSPSVTYAQYTQIGKTVCIQAKIGGTGSTTGYTMSIPFPAQTTANAIFFGFAEDNGVFQTTSAAAASTAGSSTVTVYKDPAGTLAWVAAGVRVATLSGCYEAQ